MNKPWKNEPNQKYWMYKGCLCIIWRNMFGALCGYVLVREGTKLYGVTKDDFTVHGGITYVGNMGVDCSMYNWWAFGFDCAHYNDLVPSLQMMSGIYRDIQYVSQQCELLADQIVELL